PTDHVLTALQLCPRARMPRADKLPESLQPLATRNAIRLTHERLAADVAGLVKSLRETLDPPTQCSTGKRAVQGAEVKRRVAVITHPSAALCLGSEVLSRLRRADSRCPCRRERTIRRAKTMPIWWRRCLRGSTNSWRRLPPGTNASTNCWHW